MLRYSVYINSAYFSISKYFLDQGVWAWKFRISIQRILVAQMTTHVIAYDTANPGDTSDLENKLSAFDPNTIRRLSLLVKTEGNSDLNDYSREYGLLAARVLLQNYGGRKLLDRSSFLFSTGCEGA